MRVCLSADCLCVCAHVPTLCGKLSELARQRLRQRTFRSRSPCGTAHSENTACVFSSLWTWLTNWWRFNLHSGVQCCAHPAAALQFTSLLDPNTFRHHVVVTLVPANQSIMTLVHNGVLLRTLRLVMCCSPMDVLKELEASLAIWCQTDFTQWPFVVLHPRKSYGPKKVFFQ